jgi:membrane-associated PAP2 superfamily phosphatase
LIIGFADFFALFLALVGVSPRLTRFNFRWVSGLKIGVALLRAFSRLSKRSIIGIIK